MIIHGFRHPVTKSYIVNVKENRNRPPLNIKHMTNLKAIKFGDNVIALKKKLVEYYHKCCFNPVISTSVKTIKDGHFCTLSGLSASLLQNILISRWSHRKFTYSNNIKMYGPQNQTKQEIVTVKE